MAASEPWNLAVPVVDPYLTNSREHFRALRVRGLMEIFDVNNLVLEPAKTLRLENSRIRAQAKAYAAQARLLTRELAAVRSQPRLASSSKRASDQLMET
ncbi:hypothetical protein RFN30_04255 [Mesorhizobium sp. VK23D]|nr:hypothetical protein [Mesorhizobium sp. VK23D]